MQSSVDLNNYPDMKAAGLMQLAKIGDAHAIAVKRFDPATGKQINTEVVAVSRQELIDKKIVLEKMVSDLDELISDIDNLQ